MKYAGVATGKIRAYMRELSPLLTIPAFYPPLQNFPSNGIARV